jgi:hypothetical protein
MWYDSGKIKNDFVLLTPEMIAKDKECAKLIEHFEDYIPKNTMYCYTPIKEVYDGNSTYLKTDVCPFWDKHPYVCPQMNGYCHLLHWGDWFDYDDLIWDQCKLCSFNDYNPEDLPDDCKPTEEEKELYRENEIKDIEQIKKTWKECDEFGIEH